MAPQERTMTRSCIYRVRAVCPTLRSQLYALSCSVRTRNVLLYVFHKQGDGRLKCERAFSKSHTVISSARGLNLGVFVSKAHSLSLPETSTPVSFHEINPSRRWAYHLQSGIFPIVDPVFSIRSLSVSSPLSFLHHAFWGIPVPWTNQHAFAKTGMVATFQKCKEKHSVVMERRRLCIHHARLPKVRSECREPLRVRCWPQTLH